MFYQQTACFGQIDENLLIESSVNLNGVSVLSDLI